MSEETRIAKGVLLNEAIVHGYKFFNALCEETGTKPTVDNYLEYQRRFFER